MRALLVFIYLITPSVATASHGIGLIAENLMEPVNILTDFVGTASIIIGVCALFGAFLRYMQHRTNPMIAPTSTIVLLLVIGIVLVCLPFIYLLTESGVPYKVHFF